jgi:two-component system CheB/CheR fusion protein
MGISRRKTDPRSNGARWNGRTGLRILLVEDHVATARAIQRYLETCGLQVSTAHDMNSALVLAQEEFDVLVTDLKLPDGNGWDLLDRLKNRAPFKAIAMSGFSAPSDLRRSEDAGFAEHLVKPLVPDQLMAALERLTKDDGTVDGN